MCREAKTKTQTKKVSTATCTKELKGAALAEEMRRSIEGYTRADCIRVLHSAGIVTSKGQLTKHYK